MPRQRLNCAYPTVGTPYHLLLRVAGDFFSPALRAKAEVHRICCFHVGGPFSVREIVSLFFLCITAFAAPPFAFDFSPLQN